MRQYVPLNKRLKTFLYPIMPFCQRPPANPQSRLGLLLCQSALLLLALPFLLVDSTQKKPTHVLQLPISRLDRLFCVLRLEIGDPFALPSKCLETLREDRVRVVVAGVHPVRIHGAQVLDLELEERFGELLGVPKLLGKVI